MKTAITGATGFIGKRLVQALIADGGFEVVALTRDASRARSRLPDGVEVVEWDSTQVPAPGVLDGVEAAVNLAGESIAEGRWTSAKKQAIVDSRVNTTRHLIQGMEALEPRPRVLVNGSAIGYYGYGEEEVDESSPPGSDFLAEVCKKWETEAQRASELGIRTVLLRIGIALGKGGGALQKMLTPFKLGAGGPLGSGRQWMSWVHVDDLTGIIVHALRDDGIAGPLNGTAPNPVRNKQFGKTLGRVLHRPAFMPTPGFALRALIGEFAEVLLNGQCVAPRKTIESGYVFKYPDLEGALREILG